MRKKIIGALFGTAFLIGGIIHFSIQVAEANVAVRTGKWVDVYEGGTVPKYAYCVYSFWHNKCVEGDKKGSLGLN